MIEPTVGRVVWYWQNKLDKDRGAPPMAAVIAWVHGENLVNLCVFTAGGDPMPARHVALIQDGEHPPTIGHFCEWMPYQKGQAAKTEELERAARAGGEMGLTRPSST